MGRRRAIFTAEGTLNWEDWGLTWTAPLARIEAQTVFSQLTQRFPDMRLAVAVDELTLDPGVLTGGLARLPVTW